MHIERRINHVDVNEERRVRHVDFKQERRINHVDVNEERRVHHVDFKKDRRVHHADFNEERRSYSADFKAKVALAAMNDDKSIAELAMQFAVHHTQVSLWKQQLLNNLNRVFDNDYDNPENKAKTTESHHAKIGQLTAENDFLTKVLGR
jgi:transposase